MKKSTLCLMLGLFIGMKVKEVYEENKGTIIDRVETKIKDTIYNKAETVLHKAVYGTARQTGRVERPLKDYRGRFKEMRNITEREYAFSFSSKDEALEAFHALKALSIGNDGITLCQVESACGTQTDYYYHSKHGWNNLDNACIVCNENKGVYTIHLGKLDY